MTTTDKTQPATPDMPDDEQHAECTSKLDMLLDLVAKHEQVLAQLATQGATQARALHSMQGDLAAVRTFMQSHNVALGDVRTRFDKLACMVEPCGDGRPQRKTPSTELKPVR